MRPAAFVTANGWPGRFPAAPWSRVGCCNNVTLIKDSDSYSVTMLVLNFGPFCVCHLDVM